jgi:hypothetical protein
MPEVKTKRQLKNFMIKIKKAGRSVPALSHPLQR